MKYKLTFALAASLTSTAFAAFQAPLPEFKNEKQLAEWRAEKAAETKPISVTQETAFYTGKPYLASSGDYAFKYRKYNPGLARWTSEDPSGFPDGANTHMYVNNSASYCFDFLGLMKVNGGEHDTGEEYRNRFIGQNYAFYFGNSYATADGGTGNSNGTGTINLSAFMDGRFGSESVTPSITVKVVNGGLQYEEHSTFGKSGPYAVGISYSVTGNQGDKTLTFMVRASFSREAISITGAGLSTSGVSFGTSSPVDGPVGLGTFTFTE